ncbi:MAG: hypothetical protein KJ879_00335 [Nanoarchaeota archaeon]|nr:hypothetical protein [Nanoarchaeota archaeon]
MEFKTAKQNEQRFLNYNYKDCNGRDETINRAYFYATENLEAPDEINIDVGYDGQDIVRITAILPNDLGYDFTEEEIKEALYSEEGDGFEDEKS